MSREERRTHETYSFQSAIAGVKQEHSRLVGRHRGVLQVLIESHQLGCQRIVRSTVRGHDSEVPRGRISCVTRAPLSRELTACHRHTATGRSIGNSVPRAFSDAPNPPAGPCPRLPPSLGQPRRALTRRAGARAARCAPAAPPRPPRPRRSWPGRPPAPAAGGWRGAGASPPPRRR